MTTVDTTTPKSPGWWLARLEKTLGERRKRYDTLEKYYSGNHPLPEGDDRARELFKKFQKKARTNYMELVADSIVERLEVRGFRTGGSTDPADDRDAWAIWQANHLDADSGLVHGAAAQFSDAYVIVGPAAGDGPALITGEDPRTVIVETDPTNRRRARAALKCWVDDADRTKYAVVYLPNGIHYYKAEAVNNATEATRWELEQDPAENTIGRVPVVRFVTSPKLNGQGRAEFENVIDIQDRINDTILNRLVIVKMQAYRQRWAKGVATEDEEGNELELPFVPGVDLLWAVENENAQFGDFAETSLAPILDAIKDDVKALVTLTGLPPHYVAGDIVNVSADALVALQERQVAKVKNRQLHHGESWEEVMRLAFAYAGEPDRIGPDAEVIWRDPERRSDAQVADAGVKKGAAGVPWRQRMADMGYSPQEIDRMDAERSADAALAAAFAPPPPATNAPAAG